MEYSLMDRWMDRKNMDRWNDILMDKFELYF